MREEGTLAGFVQRSLTTVALVAAVYHLAMTQWQVQGAIPHEITHVLLAFTIASLIVLLRVLRGPMSLYQQTRGVLAALCLVGAWVSLVYFRVNAVHLETVQPYIDERDFVIGAIAVSVAITVTLLNWGPIISLLVIVGIAYFFFGHLIPGALGHPEYDPMFVMSYMGASLTSGMFGPITTVSADAIFLLVLFGSLFKSTGVLALFLEVGRMVGNVVRGGAAFPAVIGSAFLGTVTGAALANVALTGRITIPAMKRSGFTSEQAGAIEAVASTGGQIAPPILGSAAFIMASFMEVPYVVIMEKAVIPALLYFAGVGIGVFFMVRASRLVLPKETVNPGVIYRHSAVFVVPMAVLVGLLLQQFSPGYSAFWAIVTLVAVASLQPATRPTFREWLDAFSEGAQLAALIAVVLIAVGIMAQAAITTNVAIKLSFTVTDLVGEQVLPILLVSMVVGILLGMELPTPVAYIIMFITVVPMMIDVGVDPFAANFFAFYFAILSTLTPPIALSVLTASRLADGRFFATCGQSMRLSIIGFVLPFGFVLNPSILGTAGQFDQTILVVCAIVFAMVAGNAAMYGYFTKPIGFWQRSILLITSFVALAYVMTSGNDLQPVLGAITVSLAILLSARVIWAMRRGARDGSNVAAIGTDETAR